MQFDATHGSVLGTMNQQILGRLMRATRKHLGLSQSTVAKQLGMDQSALSRIETGQQNLSALEWYEFCNFSKISFNCLNFGYVEGLPQSDIRVPKKYSSDQRTKVRGILPILDFFDRTQGTGSLNLFFKEKGIDPDLILNLDATVSTTLIVEMISKIHPSDSDYYEMTRSASSPKMHGDIHIIYDQVKSNFLELFKVWILNSEKYTTDAQFEITDQNRCFMDISVKACRHSILGSNQAKIYLQNYFQNFSQYNNRNATVLSVRRIHEKPKFETIFRVFFP